MKTTVNKILLQRVVYFIVISALRYIFTIEEQQQKKGKIIIIKSEQSEVRANRVDATVINHRTITATTIEMSCPWIENPVRRTGRRLS